MARLIVFDLDGTLLETAPDLVAAMNVALRAEGLAPLALEQARDLIGAGAKALIQRGLEVHGRSVTPERLDALLKIFLDHYGANIAVASAPYPGLMDALGALRDEGWRFAVCTNKLEAYARLLLDKVEMTEWFDAIAGGDTFPFRKPDGRHLTATIERAGGASTAIMVGDSAADVNAARSAGIPVIGVSFGYTTTPMRDLGPDATIDHFKEFRAALARVAGT